VVGKIGVQPHPASIGAAVEAGDPVPDFRRRIAVATQIALAAELDCRVAHGDTDALPPPGAQPSQFGRRERGSRDRRLPTVPTANEDGSAGSSPVRSIVSSADASCPTARHSAATTWLGSGGAIFTSSLTHSRQLHRNLHLSPRAGRGGASGSRGAALVLPHAAAADGGRRGDHAPGGERIAGGGGAASGEAVEMPAIEGHGRTRLLTDPSAFHVSAPLSDASRWGQQR
jgi:hypothetical protein